MSGGQGVGAGGVEVGSVAQPAGEVGEVFASPVDAYCRDRLAGYKIPKDLVVLDDLPRTPSGKVLKHVLRDQLT